MRSTRLTVGILAAYLVSGGDMAFETAATAQNLPPVAKLPPVSALTANTQLPNPLVMMDGSVVKTQADWEKKRKPELRRLFQHYMYGYSPAAPKKVTVTIEREEKRYFGGKATKREVTIHYGPEGTPPIHLLEILPNLRAFPAGVFVGLAFCGNFAVVNDPAIPIPEGWQYGGQGIANERATEAARGTAVDVWNVEQTIDRGYAIAVFFNGDVKPDTPQFTDGIFPVFHRPGVTGRDPHDWGTIAAWAYGIQRVVDFLLTDPEIDPHKIFAVGHSRCGKAAILAAAFDDRIAMAIPLQAGCGGTAPSRGSVGESVKQINNSFPHWFCDTFKEFNDQPDKLPFDQNGLVALCAPRPVLFACATEDAWANPAGQFEVLRAANDVYKLYGSDGITITAIPPENKLIDSRLGYFIRPGKHSMTKVDWTAFLDYADRQFGHP